MHVRPAAFFGRVQGPSSTPLNDAGGSPDWPRQNIAVFRAWEEQRDLLAQPTSWISGRPVPRATSSLDSRETTLTAGVKVSNALSY